MALQPGFRRFRFFEAADANGPPVPAHVACSAAGDGCLWLGCADGSVLCLSAGDLSVQASFQAHQGSVRALEWVKGKLVTVGEDGEGLRNLHLRAWAVEGLRADASPAALAPPARLLPAPPKAPAGGPEPSLAAAALRCADWPSTWVALGLSTGSTYILKVDAAKGKAAAPLPPAQLRDAGTSRGISALHFAQAGCASAPPAAAAAAEPGAAAAAVAGGTAAAAAAAAGAGELHLFVVGASRVAALEARTGQRLWEEDCGVPPGCSTVTERGELLLAATEAIYSYTAEEGRKAAYSLRGEKLAVGAARHYLVAVLAEGEGAGTAAAGAAGAKTASVQVYDLSNKVVAGAAPLEPPVAWLLPHASGAAIDVGDATGGVVRLSEKPFEERLQALYKSRSYQLAVAVAQTEQVGPAALASIRRQYGDFLYAKRDYDAAMEQYSATVGHLEPSYVIQRYLDVQRIHALTAYLEQLHAQASSNGAIENDPLQGHASCDHTTLLLNCYTKLKDVAKLEAFIQGDGRLERGALNFDVDTAIKVCRSAGYFEHALYVALAAGESRAYLDILLEDCQRYLEGLEFIRGLPRQQAATVLPKYGKALLAAAPVETTALLMDLCLQNPSDPSAYVANLAEFTHLYADRPDDLRYACVAILNMNPDSPSRQTLYHTLLDLYLSPGNPPGGGSSGGAGAGATSTAAGGGGGGGGEARSGSNQEGAGAAAAAAGERQQSGAAASSSSSSSSSSQQEALDLLKRGWPPGSEPAYDVDRALLACRLHSFRAGLLFLYENLRLYRELAGVLMAAGDRAGLIAACQRWGDAHTGGDPQLWHDALEYFAAQPDDCSTQVRELLLRIEAGGILPPLVVLQVLSKNPRLKLSLVKDYVTRQLQADSRSIRADQEEAERLKAEVERTRQQVERLQSEPVVFQSSRDSQTNAPLELPSVHFLCGHSFNLRTLGDGDAACPLCAAEHRQAQELRRSNAASATDKDTFFKQLRAAPDGFSLVAEYFGKGLLNATSVTGGAPLQ
ncbi:vacuolar -sorting-associated 11-like protein [Micractinium conductrix]|uniref:Vacuolar -sorting-associated 11-like protein n=1 Tax=Micractinium conductrix TaxID=554055 RepID=A0A2P6VN94_9CHLO|nr:vacuolar -sorting-associated 11-like protein [Micractinium conductrix]|eukprot:PSC75564.1 vacuolar -sorting-associated 11-like protein [Micractinium conductrix]